MRGPGRHQRAAAHRHHRARQHDVARSAVPRGCVGGSSRSRVRLRRSTARPPIRGGCSSRGERAAVARTQGDAPLRRRRDDGGHRAARDGVPRAAVHAARVRLPRLVARRRPDVDLRRTTAASCKLLQSRRPPDLWLFKAPHHNFHLEAIVSAYPDVRFVMTHRDPAKSVPSWASIVSTIFPRPQGERDLRRLGREVSEHLRVGVENAIAARARLGEDRFLDVHHRDLIADPMGTMRRIYEFLGLELRPPVEQAIARLASGQPLRCPRDPSLHRRAVRPEHRAAALRLRLLHPPLRRRARRLTVPERGETRR